MNRQLLKKVSLGLFILTLSCEDWLDLPQEVEYEEKIVINASLVAGIPTLPIDSIRVHTSSSIEQPFAASKNTLSGAEVILQKLLPDSTVVFTDTLYEDRVQSGLYHLSTLRFAKTGDIYLLQVSDGIHPAVEAITTVPGPVHIINDSIHTDAGQIDWDYQPMDTIVYRPAKEGSGLIHPAVFSFDLDYDSLVPPFMVRLINIALEPSPETMITEDDTLKAFLYKWNGIGDKDSTDIAMRIIQKAASSFNSTVYDRRYKVPWSAMTFYGPQLYMAVAMDESYYYYHEGFLEGPPRNYNYMPKTNVKNGYGLFSSTHISPADFRYYYLKRPQ